MDPTSFSRAYLNDAHANLALIEYQRIQSSMGAMIARAGDGATIAEFQGKQLSGK